MTGKLKNGSSPGDCSSLRSHANGWRNTPTRSGRRASISLYTAIEETILLSPPVLAVLKAQQADQVRSVAMKVLPLAGRVQAHRRAVPHHPGATDVTQQVTCGVLAHRSTQVQPKTDIRQLRLRLREHIDREAADQHERPARRQLANPAVQLRRQARQQEIPPRRTVAAVRPDLAPARAAATISSRSDGTTAPAR
jgi:hypothetical protein